MAPGRPAGPWLKVSLACKPTEQNVLPLALLCRPVGPHAVAAVAYQSPVINLQPASLVVRRMAPSFAAVLAALVGRRQGFVAYGRCAKQLLSILRDR